jgi:chromosome partitioning protein
MAGKILAISIFKGGTVKTTTAVSLSAALARLGANVLLIDLDQQASATRHVGLEPENETMNMFHVFKRQIPASTAAKELPFGFKIIPGNSLLAAVEAAMEEGDETLLRDLLEGIRHEYDYMILDSPPGKGMIALNALAAADEAIIPLQAERPALDGVQDLLKFIYEVVWDGYNPKLKIGGILPTMYKKTTTHSPSVIETARKIWKENVMPLEVPESIAFPRAFNDGMPLIFSEPGHPAALAYVEVAEIIHPHAKATQPPIAALAAEPVTLEPYEGNQ